MKRNFYLIPIILICISGLFSGFATAADYVYEDAEDGHIDGWRIYDNTPTGAIINNVYDEQSDSRVIRIDGAGVTNGFILGNLPGKEGAWNNTQSRVIRWSMLIESSFIYVSVQTQNGHRYLTYTNKPVGTNSSYVVGGDTYIQYGLGSPSYGSGSVPKLEWRTITRDLQADLKQFESNNTILSVNAFLVRGNDGEFDDIKLLGGNDGGNEESDVNGWQVYDKNPSGARIQSVYDAELAKDVVEFTGSGVSNGYSTSNWSGKDAQGEILQWQMNFNEPFLIYFSVETLNGQRYFLYNNAENTTGFIEEHGGVPYLRYGLGAESGGGSWQTISRNLEEDLQNLEPSNQIVSTQAFLVRGSGRIFDLKSLASESGGSLGTETLYSDAEDGSTDGWRVYTGNRSASILNVYDAEKNSSVIEFDSAERRNGFILGNFRGKDGAWNNTQAKKLQFSMSYEIGKAPWIYLRVLTQVGEQYLSFSSGPTIFYFGNPEVTDLNGSWKSYTIDLEKELGSEIFAVDALLVRGTARIDDVKLLSE